ncbi:g4287 [Coccomyxa viridis]|uniref:G4287 protein n=1 Tax=Coccomyxa viridis TaxID=1274662 RepID=A0ABP1FS92_9CHLO
MNDAHRDGHVPSIALAVEATNTPKIGGGWLIFQTVRVQQPFWWAILGGLILVVYGFIPTFQPISNFGRVFAVYGGFFIVLSYAWGWLLSGERPDKGDYIGAGIALCGVLVAWFWPRKQKAAQPFHWTAPTVVLAVVLFLVAGLCEIGGGWLVWQAVREGKSAFWGAAGGVVLIAYGFVPTAQPILNFGRIYAVYGGFFIVLSYAWGWAVDRERPDAGDCIGALVAIAGVAVAFFFPR